MRIDACFDSHVHWPMTGEHAQQLRIEGLRGPSEILSVSYSNHHKRGAWLLGFGWDQHDWLEKPHRTLLDRWYPDGPVALSRCDGHVLWVNTEALRLAGLWDNPELVISGGRIERDSDGRPTGVLVDMACDPVHRRIPDFEPLELRRNLIRGMQIFNTAGFTHIRDMTCDERQWNEAVKLDESGILTLAVEEYFWLRGPEQLDSTLDLASRARQSQSPNLRAKGLKVFLDGALGSEGAHLSRCYHGKDHKGLLLWDREALATALARTWAVGLDVAVHVIGDEAAHILVNLAVELNERGVSGPLHLEHCQLLRPDTIEAMRGLTIQCHIQPSHWLSDRRWMKAKLGDLSATVFQWRKLQEADVKFDFGSDAPIEPASIVRTLQALRESSEEGVPRLLGNPSSYMSHADLGWAPNSYTILEGENPAQVVFRGQHLL